MLHTVCSYSALPHYDPTLYLLHAFGSDIGDTQVVSNIANNYLKHIHLYMDMVFSMTVLHGKDPKTRWCYCVAYSADKGTVGQTNQLMVGAGFRDNRQYR